MLVWPTWASPPGGEGQASVARQLQEDYLATLCRTNGCPCPMSFLATALPRKRAVRAVQKPVMPRPSHFNERAPESAVSCHIASLSAGGCQEQRRHPQSEGRQAHPVAKPQHAGNRGGAGCQALAVHWSWLSGRYVHQCKVTLLNATAGVMIYSASLHSTITGLLCCLLPFADSERVLVFAVPVLLCEARCVSLASQHPTKVPARNKSVVLVQVQALRSIEQHLGLEKLYVLGTNCVDNGARKGLDRFLRAASTRPDEVLHYEFMQASWGFLAGQPPPRKLRCGGCLLASSRTVVLQPSQLMQAGRACFAGQQLNSHILCCDLKQLSCPLDS